eukprot:UN00115
MCLILICSRSFEGKVDTKSQNDGIVKNNALHTFVHYGGFQSGHFGGFNQMNQMNQSMNNSTQQNRSGFNGYMNQTNLSQPIVCPGIHAMYQYFSRLVRPVWNWTITRKFMLKRVLRFNERELDLLQAPLVRFENFLTQNIGDTSNTSFRTTAEGHALYQLKSLLSRSVEGFHLLKIMADTESFDAVRGSLDKKNRQLLEQLEFSTLVSTQNGREACRSYITALIRLGKGHNYVENLNRMCPTFFHDSVHLIFEATKIIEEIYEAGENYLDRQKVQKAMDKYKLACMHPGFDLKRCCDTLRCAHLFYDVVELVDYYIEKVLALQTPGQTNLTVMDCYNEIFSCFNLILNQRDRFLTKNGDKFSLYQKSSKQDC